MSRQRNPVDLAILTGYTMPPMYFDANDGEYYNRTVEEASEFFGLSSELTRDLNAWNKEYQDTFNIDVPQDSGFATEGMLLAWLERGKRLAERIRVESDLVGAIDYQGNGRYKNGECLI